MKLSADDMEIRRQEMLAAAFRLFSERNIDAVTMGDIAKETGYTIRSLQRYFNCKEALVVEVGAWAFERFVTANRARNPEKTGTAADVYAFFLDSFLTLYREHRDLLRFNQFFNVYIQARHVSREQMQPYTGMIDMVKERFHAIYRKGQQDGTLRTEVPEVEMFSATLHLMLAVVTRYAVGLAYDTGVEAERELMLQRNMLLAQYTKH